MSADKDSRRTFLIRSTSGVGATWLAANYAGIAAAQDYVHASGDTRGFAFFTEAQATEVEAMAAQIIPTDQTSGAREARVINFIDRVLVTFDSERQSDYTEGLEELATQTARRFPGKETFSALSNEQQIELLTAIEDTPYFNLVRTHTITGFFASPLHGGNHDRAGWELVGYDDSLDHTPPFGYYDGLPESRR
jgi:gluconate 2-dehydrogenase gamma chain